MPLPKSFFRRRVTGRTLALTVGIGSLALLSTGGALVRQLADLSAQDRHLYSLGYVGFQVSSVLSLGLALRYRGSVVRWGISLVYLLAVVLDLLSRWALGAGFTLGEVPLALGEFGFGNVAVALREHAPAIATALFGAGAVALWLGWSWRQHPPRGSWRTLVPLALTTAVSVAYLHASRGFRIQLEPLQRAVALLVYEHRNRLYEGPRDPARANPTAAPLAAHTVLVIDESVRYATVASPETRPRVLPFVHAHAAEAFVDLGETASATVCSRFSTHVLTAGGALGDYPDVDGHSLRRASVFAYAQKAGAHTALLYNQGRQEGLEAYFRESDLETIDLSVRTLRDRPTLPDYMADSLSLLLIDSLTRVNASTFTVVFKHGSHFNYASNYPPWAAYDQPSAAPDDRLVSDQTATTNAYHNSVRYATDRFFRQADSLFVERDILFVYTSDHGQNLFDDPDNIITHCVARRAHPSMAAVPLWLWSPRPEHVAWLRASIPAANYGHATHFAIPPTLLTLFGYEADRPPGFREPSLFEPIDTGPRKYLSGDLFGRGGSYVNDFE